MCQNMVKWIRTLNSLSTHASVGLGSNPSTTFLFYRKATQISRVKTLNSIIVITCVSNVFMEPFTCDWHDSTRLSTSPMSFSWYHMCNFAPTRYHMWLWYFHMSYMWLALHLGFVPVFPHNSVALYGYHLNKEKIQNGWPTLKRISQKNNAYILAWVSL